MSGKQSGMVWDIIIVDSKSVSKEGKQIVLLAMADHADHEGENVYPSIGLLAWKTGYSPRQVVRIIKCLIADRLIDLEDMNYGKYRTRRYSLHLDRGTLKTRYEGRRSLRPPPVTSSVTPPCDIAVSHPPVTSGCHPNRQGKPSGKPSDPGDSKTESPPPANFTIVGKSYVNGAKLPASIRGGAEKKTKRVKVAKLSDHIGVQKFYQVRGVMPRKETYPLIAQALGEHPTTADLDFWTDVIRYYVACGWNKTNVAGMLDWYKRRELPHASKGNGAKPVREEPESGLATLDDIRKNNPELYARILAKNGGNP